MATVFPIRLVLFTPIAVEESTVPSSESLWSFIWFLRLDHENQRTSVWFTWMVTLGIQRPGYEEPQGAHMQRPYDQTTSAALAAAHLRPQMKCHTCEDTTKMLALSCWVFLSLKSSWAFPEAPGILEWREATPLPPSHLVQLPDCEHEKQLFYDTKFKVWATVTGAV